MKRTVVEFDGLLGGMNCPGDRPSEDGYRPPLLIPPADRPTGNGPFCGAFSPIIVSAVGAVGISHGLCPIAYLRPACILLPGQYSYGLRGSASGYQRLAYRVPGPCSLPRGLQYRRRPRSRRGGQLRAHPGSLGRRGHLGRGRFPSTNGLLTSDRQHISRVPLSRTILRRTPCRSPGTPSRPRWGQRVVHWRSLHRHRRDTVRANSPVGQQRPLHARRSHRLAHSPQRPDYLRHRGLGPLPAPRRRDRGDLPG